jgi:Flp pilus assembly pilin Flp
MMRDESGAVTVDWVVLTAAVVVAFIAMIVPMSSQVDALLGETGSVVENVIAVAKTW